MNERSKSFIYLHLSVFLFGFTAILGELISIDFISLVLWRSIFTVGVFIIIIRPTVLFRSMPTQSIIHQFFIGFLLAMHWLGFYASIKISSPTMALIALSSSSLVTGAIEPLINKKITWNKIDLIMGLLIIPGFLMIFYNSDQIQKSGLIIGFGASILGATFSILNKKWLVIGQEMKMTFLQILAVGITVGIIVLFIPDKFQLPQKIDWLYFSIFAIFCTVISYYLYLLSMRKLNAFDISFAFNMEPVYGIFMAALLLHDNRTITNSVYIGMIYIFTVVFLDTYLKLKRK